MQRLKKIMVVDDEMGLRNLLLDALSGKGFKVATARDGQDSLKQMRKHRFDLLITDVNMPHLDGIGLLKSMKRAGRKEKVIIMTAGAFDHRRHKKEIPPVFTQLQKPFHMNKFLEAVNKALAPHKKREQKGGLGQA